MTGEYGMKRQQAREEAFLMLCESGFDAERTAAEIYETATAARGVEEDDFTKACLEGVIAHREEIDSIIEKHASGWKRSRLSVVTAAVLQLATYEMVYREDIPVNVSLNEAIELSKKYDDEKARAFVNGVLNAISTAAKQEKRDAE